MSTPIFTGTIDKGKLLLDQPQKYLIQISTLNGKKVELILRKKRNPRSIRQNAFYWGVVIGPRVGEEHGKIKHGRI